MKAVLIFFALVIGSILGIHHVLQSGQLVAYLDSHPDPKTVPPIAFYVGEGYYLFRDLQNSATYYQRISDRYPDSKYADDAYFNYLQSLDEMNTPRPQMAELYASYAERFPEGKHLEVAQKRNEFCRNNR